MKSSHMFTRIVAAALLVLGCQSSTEDPVTDTNTNWLEVCDQGDSCGGLECLCNVCTRECETDADCSGLGDGAVCSDAEDSCGADTVCVAGGSSSEGEGGEPEPAPSGEPTNDGGCEGAMPECPGACGTTQAGVCNDGEWVCPGIVDIGCPPATECTGEAPACSAECGGAQPGVCSEGAWTCPPITTTPCVCEGTAPDCDDGCGGTTPGICVDGTWTCAEQVAGCPVTGEGGAGNGGTGGTTANGGGSSSGGTSDGGTSSGGTSSGGTSSGGTSSGGSAGTNGGGSGGSVVSDSCETAVDGQACSLEGMRCGSCPDDPCQFCNLMTCTGGVWRRLEAFPAPCFDCGMDLRCQQNAAVCRIESGAVYSEECVEVPEACADALDCVCLEAEVPEFTCTELSPGSFVVERSD